MLKKLTAAQRAAYDENGYVDRIDIFTASEVEEIVAELAEAEAALLTYERNPTNTDEAFKTQKEMRQNISIGSLFLS